MDGNNGHGSAWVETFSASLRSVGTAVALASTGLYLHRRGFLNGDGKRTLALISQQVTIPLLFFTKIIYCNQDWSSDPCPDVTESLQDVWMLLWWPLYVVGMGLLVGFIAAKVTHTPQHQVRAVMAACGFSNSTGLPITLLTVVHANFPKTSDLGRIDPCLFLTVYLLLYPVLQWGIGGWLLAPQHSEDGEAESNPHGGGMVLENVLNRRESSFAQFQRRGMREVDASLYISVPESLDKYGRPKPPSSTDSTSDEESQDDILERYTVLPKKSLMNIGMNLSRANSSCGSDSVEGQHHVPMEEMIQTYPVKVEIPEPKQNGLDETTERALLIKPRTVPMQEDTTPSQDGSISKNHTTTSRWQTLRNVAERTLQPPVIGALLGILVASFPTARGVLVDLDDRDGDAPLQWLFDGLYEVGQAAVPINMMILGCNLSGSFSSSVKPTALFSSATSMAILIGKMVIMPVVGFVSVCLFREYFWSLPEEIAGSFYLVVMIVFLTPTANNVMVMVELSGSGSKQGLARIIAWQYAAAPILLSLTMTIAVGMADRWSS
eukprot:scaffold248_cov111-Cylindrotheca_fusiformis.AAC.12